MLHWSEDEDDQNNSEEREANGRQRETTAKNKATRSMKSADDGLDMLKDSNDGDENNTALKVEQMLLKIENEELSKKLAVRESQNEEMTESRAL